VRSLPNCYKQEKSRVQLVVRQSVASKDMNTEVEGSTSLEAVTRTTTGEHTVDREDLVRAVVNC
jgi:hypothetical protein